MAFTEDVSINTLIGLGSSFHGDMHVNGFVRIDGDVDGNIETSSNVLVGEKARIRGNITASSAIVGGIIEGNIQALGGIKLLSTSAVIGDITTKSLQIEENVIFQGHIISIKDDKKFETVSRDFENQKAIQSRRTVSKTSKTAHTSDSADQEK